VKRKYIIMKGCIVWRAHKIPVENEIVKSKTFHFSGFSYHCASSTLIESFVERKWNIFKSVLPNIEAIFQNDNVYFLIEIF
jgi:hypothetical protein